MIDGLFFLMSCVAIGLIAGWIMQNDGVRPGGRTIGFFAMPFSDAAAPGKATKRKLGRTRRLSREG